MFNKPKEGGSRHYREALKAYEEGRWIYAPVLVVPMSLGNGWSNEIGEIESAGWQLEHWAITQAPQGGVVPLPASLVAAPVFRRRP